MDRDIVSEHTYSVGDRRLRRLAAPDRTAPQGTSRLSRGQALITISAVSLGLWAAMAAAIRSLASILVP